MCIVKLFQVVEGSNRLYSTRPRMLSLEFKATPVLDVFKLNVFCSILFSSTLLFISASL